MKKIKLTKGKYALVDNKDFNFLNQWKWHLSDSGGVVRVIGSVKNKNRKNVWMHRLILSPHNNMQVDHINHNRLDNRRKNLRVCTQSENNQNKGAKIDNTSGYKGVSKHKGWNKWVAEIMAKGVRIRVGGFNTPKEAFKVYCKLAKKYHGKFAKTK